MMRPLGWTGLLITLVAVVLVGRNILTPRSVRPPTVGESLRWRERRVGGVALEAPGDFQEMKVDFGLATESIEKADAYQFASRTFEIQIIRLLYTEETTLSLEDSVRGSVEGFGRTPGLRILTHKDTPCTVSGKPAMRVFITADRPRGGVRLEGLTILDGRTLYQVQALFEERNRRATQDARKILDSIRIGQ